MVYLKILNRFSIFLKQVPTPVYNEMEDRIRKLIKFMFAPLYRKLYNNSHAHVITIYTIYMLSFITIKGRVSVVFRVLIHYSVHLMVNIKKVFISG